ncbi:MAG: M42 family metallopeptidase [Candidatus Freyarchaeota archaeon]|nr:M42 family metallopeptidase [Candidatus Freyrarchaeum guaymaensis]
MGESLKSTLKRLVEACAPPGYEENVRRIIREELEGHVDEIREDRLGNLICIKKGGKGRLKVMIAAHMDEIGMVVKYIEKEGFIRFAYLGGFFDQTVLNQRVLVHTEKESIPGVIGATPPHLLPEERRKKTVERNQMFIDIGATSREEAEKWGVKVGSPITWVGDMIELKNGHLCGKAFDDRVGCLILIEVMKSIDPEVDVYGVASVMEEVGLRGARTSTFSINPDMGIAIDVTATGDYPGVEERDVPVRLGKGPAITVADGRRESLGGGLISHPLPRSLLIETAEENNIPYQLEVFEGGTTDATEIALARGGVPAAVLSIPTRYIHTPVEVLNVKDVENAIKLVRLALEKAHEKIV